MLRKLFLLFLLVIAAALGIVLLFRQKPEFPVLLFTFFSDVSLGIIAGLGVRNVLRNQGWFARGVAAAAIVIVGLAVIGYFTDWKIGIGPMEFGRPTVDWLGLTQMVIAVDTAWITMRAWNQAVSRLVEPAPRGTSQMARRRSTRAASTASPRVQLPRSWSVWPKARVRTRAASQARGGARPAVLTLTGAAPARPKRRGAGLFRRRPQVQLAITEEHRCPYCLDPVLRTDARGVKECEVCHTLHHADCWAITGTCQVPHLNT